MSAVDTLIALAVGARPDGDDLLGSCRCEWQGEEIYGEEALVEMFRAAPMMLDGAVRIETPMGLALFTDDAALIADLYDGHIGRLWRLSAGDYAIREPAVSVAFDPDLAQARLDVHFAASDHPELPSALHQRVIEAGRRWVRDGGAGEAIPAHRMRAFVLRAFAAGDRATILFAVHRLGGGMVREAGFDYVAMCFDGPGEPHVIAAPHAARAWQPRL
jgi:hypothetical protein